MANQVYTCINGLSNQGLKNLFTYSKNSHTHNTRSASKMNLHSNQHYYKSFSSIGITVWNSIPVEIRSANSLSFFCIYQYNFHKLVCYVCKTFNSRIYHMCRIKCVKISHFLINYTVNYMCMILRGPIAN